MKLSRNFYIRPTEKVAKDLLGRTIFRKTEGETLRKGKIVELEIYKGPEDKAAHSKNGKKTDRNKIFWEKGGLLYVYLIYGIHWMVNIVTEKEGNPEAILIRAIDAEEVSMEKVNGPGKVADYFEIDKSFYGENLAESDRVWVGQGREEVKKIIKTPRINIDYAGSPWKDKKWRLLLADYRDRLPGP